MQFDGFDWDGGNLRKCQKHGVSLDEVEDLFSRRILILDDPFDAQVERRYRGIGFTAEGRALFVVFTMRNNAIRPLSARYMHLKEVKQYEENNPGVSDRRRS